MKIVNYSQNLSFLVIGKRKIVKRIDKALNRNYNFFMCETNSFEEALEILKAISIDIIFLNISIGGEVDFDLINILKNIQPSSKLFILFPEIDYFVLKKSFEHEVEGALNIDFEENEILVLMDAIFTDNILVTKQDKITKLKPKDFNFFSKLSDREREIAHLLVKGKGNKEISGKLNITMSTVSTYKKRIFDKLKIKSIISLAEIMKDNSGIYA